MSIQFDTFDNLSDRRELMILFQKFGPEPQANILRAQWLEKLISTSIFQKFQVNPAQCTIVGAYMLFIQIVGVLGVPIRKAAQDLERYICNQKL